MSESNANKAATSRGAAAQSGGDTSVPANRQTTQDAQQETGASTGDDQDGRLDAAVEATEAAAKRAEEAAARIDEALEQFRAEIADLPDSAAVQTGTTVDQSAVAAKKVRDAAKPEIGSAAWQKQNRLAALDEELGFAKAKGQKDRVKAIEDEISRVEKD